MATKSPRKADDTVSGGHPAFTEGGVAPVSTVTDTWTTASPKPDATNLSSLPKAVANAIDGKDHSEDPEFPDQGGRVMDEAVAAANRGGNAQ